MQFVFVTPSASLDGNHCSVAKAHAARLGVAKRRKAQQRLIQDILDGRAPATDRRLVISLSGRKERSLKPAPRGGNARSQDARIHQVEGDEQADGIVLSKEQVDSQLARKWSPYSLIGKGNSDPFDTTAVVIDATANELMKFSRECFVPWIDSLERGQEKLKSYRNKLVLTPFESLHHPASAHATLATMAIVLGKSTGNAGIMMYAHKVIGGAYNAVQELISTDGTAENTLPLRILSLLAFEIMAQNRQACSVHARALQLALYDAKLRRQSIDAALLNAAVFHDINRSIMFMERPIIDLSLLVDRHILQDGQKADRSLYSNNLLKPTPLSKFVETALPWNICQLVDRYKHLLRLGMKQEDSSTIHHTSNAWIQNSAMLASQIMHAFQDARDVLVVRSEERQSLHQQAAICIAVIYWGMLFTHPNVCAYYLDTSWWRDGPANLFIAADFLRGARIDALIQGIDWRQSDAPPSLRLWLHYVSLLAEHSTGVIRLGEKAYLIPQNRQFVTQAERMGLREWSDVVEELDGYLFACELGPECRVWFERGMKELLMMKQLQVEWLPHLDIEGSSAEWEQGFAKYEKIDS